MPLCTPRTCSFACRGGRGYTSRSPAQLAVRAGFARHAAAFLLPVGAPLTRGARRAVGFQLAVRAGLALRAKACQLAVGARVAVRAVAFHLPVGSGVARHAVVFHLAVRAGVALCAPLFHLAVGTRVTLLAPVFPLSVRAPLHTHHYRSVVVCRAPRRVLVHGAS